MRRLIRIFTAKNAVIRAIYLHQHENWTQFEWNSDEILTLLAEVRNLQGRLLGKMGTFGFDLQNEAILETLTLDVLKNNEIEGEILDTEEVRSSIARKLGIDFTSSKPITRYVDGVVEMMLDATQNYLSPLTKERLCNWHAALFPTGRSGMHPITVANWRKDDKGPMQVVSGAMGKEKIHFEAPDSMLVEQEMQQFLEWFNADTSIDDVLKAAIAHLWFITIHPFDDGNGRITRAITDMQLARSDKSQQRFYSMSNQILQERKAYYQILEKTQKGKQDITQWIVWFLNCLKNALLQSEAILANVIQKAEFWNKHRDTPINNRQQKMLNKLFDGLKGKLTTSKWAKMCKCSQDTALRDIQDLERKGMLKKGEKSGRGTAYWIDFE